MKKIITILAIYITAFATGSPDKENFSNKLLKIHNDADVESLISLVEFNDSTPQNIREMHRSQFLANSKLEIISVKFEPLTENDIFSYEMNGNTFVPTLNPVGKFMIDYAPQKGSSDKYSSGYTVGIKNGQYRIITAMIKK